MTPPNKQTLAKSENKKTRERDALRWLFAQIRSVLHLLAFASLGQIVLSGIGVGVAFCSRDIIDAATEGTRGRFYQALFTLLGALVLSILISIFNSAISERLRARTGIAIQRRVFSILLRKDYESASTLHSGDALNRLTSDVKVVSEGASSIVPSLAALSTRLVFSFVALCYFDVKLALVFFFGGFFVFGFATLYRKRIKLLHKEMQAAEGRKRAFWSEAFQNLFVVKSFLREPEMDARSDELLEDHYRATMRRRNFGLLASGGLHTLFTFGYWGALAWQSYRIFNGTATFGETIAVLELVGAVQSPFTSLSGLIPRYYNAIASAERIRELEDLPDEEASFEEPYDARELYERLDAIVFDGASFSYRREGKEVEVLADASFEWKKGENVVVSGRSGIGKSTLFKILTGVCRLKSGRAYLRLTNGEELPLNRRARGLFALVPQGNMILSGTIAENIAFFKKGAEVESIRRAAEAAEATFIDETPDGFDARLGENGRGLSEGQIQRVAVARALFSDAPILLLDEATSALDSKTERTLLERLTQRTDKMVVVVSHRPTAFEFIKQETKIQGDRVASVVTGDATR